MSEQEEGSVSQTLVQSTADDPSSEQSSRGIVYVLSNEAMEDYIKVGKTGGDSTASVLGRMRDLGRATGVPRPFTCEYAAVVNDYEKVEAAIFRIFRHNRVQGKEFLQDVNSLQVKAVLELLNPVEVTPGGTDGEEDLDGSATEGKRASFKFAMAGVSLGESIEWASDSSIVATVVGASQVDYGGDNFALSRITAMLLNRKQPHVGYAEQYWLFKGRTLQGLRTSMES